MGYILECRICGWTMLYESEEAVQNKATAHYRVSGHLNMKLTKVTKEELGLELK